MEEENNEQPEPVLTEEEKSNEDKVNKLLSEVLKVDVESAGRFKLMVIPNQEHPELSSVAVVFIPRKGGMSQTALSVNFVDIAGFIMDVSREFVKRRNPYKVSMQGNSSPMSTDNDRMMVS